MYLYWYILGGNGKDVVKAEDSGSGRYKDMIVKGALLLNKRAPLTCIIIYSLSPEDLAVGLGHSLILDQVVIFTNHGDHAAKVSVPVVLAF